MSRGVGGRGGWRPGGGRVPVPLRVFIWWAHRGGHGARIVGACQPGSATFESVQRGERRLGAVGSVGALRIRDVDHIVRDLAARGVDLRRRRRQRWTWRGRRAACLCVPVRACACVHVRVRACVCACLLRDVDPPLAEQRRDRADHPWPVLVDEAEARVLARERGKRRVGEVDRVGDRAWVTCAHARACAEVGLWPRADGASASRGWRALTRVRTQPLVRPLGGLRGAGSPPRRVEQPRSGRLRPRRPGGRAVAP